MRYAAQPYDSRPAQPYDSRPAQPYDSRPAWPDGCTAVCLKVLTALLKGL
ncbi:hypothetical protein [Paenibacillus protaetiae]|nr:hypothetical protein [Paenibacillus protaetiae]